jgi:hypothetical protein
MKTCKIKLVKFQVLKQKIFTAQKNVFSVFQWNWLELACFAISYEILLDGKTDWFDRRISHQITSFKQKKRFSAQKRFSSCFQWNYFELACFIILVKLI